MRWEESGSSLSVSRQGPGFQLSTEEFRELRAAGIKGNASVYLAHAEYGSGKKGSVLILIQKPVSGSVMLKEPDGSNIVYFQTDGVWKKYPAEAPTLNRTIALSPEPSDPRQTQVLVELATGARMGFDVWWPKSEVRPHD